MCECKIYHYGLLKYDINISPTINTTNAQVSNLYFSTNSYRLSSLLFFAIFSSPHVMISWLIIPAFAVMTSNICPPHSYFNYKFSYSSTHFISFITFSYIEVANDFIIRLGTIRPQRSDFCAHLPVRIKSSGNEVTLFNSPKVNFLSSFQ